jgi:hypothetical protein
MSSADPLRWLGSQRNNAVVWSGDIASTFDSLRIQIRRASTSHSAASLVDHRYRAS